MPARVFDPIADIQDLLRRYPQAQYDANEDGVVVYPQDETGFRVEFRATQDRFRVFCDGWHHDFVDAEEALEVFAFALTDDCRLEVHKRGRKIYRWILQRRDKTRWKSVGEVRTVFAPFWLRSRAEYLQNHFVAAA